MIKLGFVMLAYSHSSPHGVVFPETNVIPTFFSMVSIQIVWLSGPYFSRVHKISQNFLLCTSGKNIDFFLLFT